MHPSGALNKNEFFVGLKLELQNKMSTTEGPITLLVLSASQSGECTTIHAVHSLEPLHMQAVITRITADQVVKMLHSGKRFDEGFSLTLCKCGGYTIDITWEPLADPESERDMAVQPLDQCHDTSALMDKLCYFGLPEIVYMHFVGQACTVIWFLATLSPEPFEKNELAPFFSIFRSFGLYNSDKNELAPFADAHSAKSF